MSAPDPDCPDCGNAKVAKQLERVRGARHRRAAHLRWRWRLLRRFLWLRLTSLSLLAYGDVVAGCERCALSGDAKRRSSSAPAHRMRS